MERRCGGEVGSPVIGVPGRFEGFTVAKDFPLKC